MSLTRELISPAGGLGPLDYFAGRLSFIDLLLFSSIYRLFELVSLTKIEQIILLDCLSSHTVKNNLHIAIG